MTIFIGHDFPNAARLYGEAIEKNPNESTLWCNRAYARMKLEEFGYAISDASGFTRVLLNRKGLMTRNEFFWLCRVRGEKVKQSNWIRNMPRHTIGKERCSLGWELLA